MSRRPCLLHRSVIALAVAVPLVTVACASPTDDGSDTGNDALSSGKSGILKGATLRVTASQVNLRASAGITGEIVTVLQRDDVVTCIADAGSSGWINVKTTDGETGWASLLYLAQVTAGGTGAAPPPDADTCSPDRAVGIVSKFEKALHDTISFSEGTKDEAKDGYNVMFGGTSAKPSTFADCSKHPNHRVPFGKTFSTAAGRYQFLFNTWSSIASVRGYATFEPENQERGGQYLIQNVRKATVPQDRALTAAEFEVAITKLSFEWASLPPGQYGQPQKSMPTLRSKYCSFVDCEADPPPDPPADPPPDPQP